MLQHSTVVPTTLPCKSLLRSAVQSTLITGYLISRTTGLLSCILPAMHGRQSQAKAPLCVMLVPSSAMPDAIPSAVSTCHCPTGGLDCGRPAYGPGPGCCRDQVTLTIAFRGSGKSASCAAASTLPARLCVGFCSDIALPGAANMGEELAEERE